ncbi:MAG: tyrosine-type recombinase/integrase [Steroidobacteraceae bacterium]
MSIQRGGATSRARTLSNRHAGARKFTATRLGTLPLGRHKDPGQEGLYMLVRPRKSGSCSRTWVHRINYQGGDTYLLIGHFPATRLADARITVQEQREQIAKGINPKAAAPRRRRIRPTDGGGTAPAPGDRHSVEFLVSEFMRGYIEKRHKKPDYVRLMLDVHVLPHWTGRDARTIGKRDIIERTDAIANGNGARSPAPAMANRVNAQIMRMLDYGEERGIIEEAPRKRLSQPGGPEKSRDRALSDAELTALLASLDDVLRSPRMTRAIRILLGTAQRVGELAHARWSDIDFKAATWTIPKEISKNRTENVVPLSDYVLNEFQRLKAGAALRAQFVLPTDDGTASCDPKLITRCVARNQRSFNKKGIAKFTPHDLRRTARTRMAALGIDEHIAERVLNHKIPGMAGVYNMHKYAAEVRAALDKWATHIESLAASADESAA